MAHKPGTQTVFRDVTTLALLGFVAVVILILSHINPPESGKNETVPPGNVIVEIRWLDGMDVDVDLWVKAPTDVAVGYSNLNGKYFNLLRDDLGNYGDPLNLNYENAYTRGVIPGEYVVNVHLYNVRTLAVQESLPMTVDVAVSIAKQIKAEDGTNSRAVRLLFQQIRLKHIGHEVTVFRFALDENGDLIEGSVHNTPIELRAFKKWSS